ncbi:MAG: hypothetical protein ACP5OJ_04025, partial [Methanothermobacter sp.]
MNKNIAYINSIFIAILAVIATLAGLLWQNFYIKDAVSAIPQIMGQDLVTLIICVPILLLSLYFISKESLKGQLFWLGVIFYFLYTYASNAFLVSYNSMFLVYVAIFSISLYTFIYGLISIDLKTIKNSFKTGLTPKIAAIFTILMATLMALMWLSMIIGSLISGNPPNTLDSYTTLVIQALDLGVVAPAAILAGILLLKGEKWGYALMSILLVKISLIGTAILSMAYFMVQDGLSISWGQAIFFLVATIAGIIITMTFYNKIEGKVEQVNSSYKVMVSGK